MSASKRKAAMKKFAGNRPLIEIKRACRAQRLEFDDHAFKAGSDFVFIRRRGVGTRSTVAYNTFNGRFFGTIQEGPLAGTNFNSDSTKHEREPWFQALLSFFYVEKGERAAPRNSTMIELTLGGVALLQGGAA